MNGPNCRFGRYLLLQAPGLNLDGLFLDLATTSSSPSPSFTEQKKSTDIAAGCIARNQARMRRLSIKTEIKLRPPNSLHKENSKNTGWVHVH